MEQLRNAFLKARYDLNFSSPLELRIALHPRGVMPPWMARKGLALCAPGFYSFRPRNGSGFVPGRFHTNMTVYDQLQTDLRHTPRLWLVTGVAGFIGSHLLETLLRLNQRVVGLDNFEAGKRANLDQVRTLVAPAQWAAFRFIEGDIADPAACQAACAGWM